MRHPDDGVLRRMLDEPLTIRDSDRAHYKACRQCQERLTGIAESARLVRESLAPLSVSTDVGRALEATSRRLAANASASRRFAVPYAWLRFRKPVGGTAAALALAGVVAFTPAGSLAEHFVTVFQPNHVVAVSISRTDLHALLGLRKYGTFHMPASTPSTQVATAAEASKLSGMRVLVPASLPSGVPAQVRYGVTYPTSGSFTFSAARARAAAAAQGEEIPAMPAHMDGSTLQVTIPAGVLAMYGSSSGDIPALAIGQVRAPTIKSSGVTASQLEDYLLSMPGISSTLAGQIRAMGDPTSALPIPVPINLAQAQHVQVQGVTGLAIGDDTGVGSGVVWEKDGIVYAVGGALSESQAIAIANALQ